jgi:molybdopterin-guanine dinucleotide biosynthesis protein A
MGRDKALIDVDGEALCVRTARVLEEAGALDVVAIGGDGDAIGALGLEWHADLYPGDGPLGGIITALRVAAGEVVVVVATDLVALTPSIIHGIVAGLTPGADVVLADSGRLEPLCGVWRRRAEPLLTAAFAAGERAVHAAVADLAVVTVLVDPATLRNVNAPEDL